MGKEIKKIRLNRLYSENSVFEENFFMMELILY